MTAFTLALLQDARGEEWPSMELVGEMLEGALRRRGDLAVVASQPTLPRLFRKAAALPPARALNLDRALGRYLLYPPRALRLRASADAFHVVDHSYAHLLLTLPAGRSGVYCHDLDAFTPWLDRRGSRLQRALARTLFLGLSRARVVFHSTGAVGDALARAGVPRDRLVLAPYGSAPEFSPGPGAPEPAAVAELGGVELERPYWLQVASDLPRKRVDVALQAFAAARATRPELRLVTVGGPLTGPHQQLAQQVLPAGAHRRLSRLSRGALALLYRHAEVVLVPSSAEGFGLPVLEGLACGAAVAAADLATLREVGGEAASYAPVGDPLALVDAAARARAIPRALRLARAEGFSWDAHAATIAQAYRARIAAPAPGR